MPNHAVQPIAATTGETFVLTLDSNPSTGYQWQLATAPDATIVKLVRSEYTAPATQRVGAGGEEVWTFQAVGTGHTTVTLKYVRPWEGNVAPVDQRTFTITVRPR